ncbi:DUF6082 family protein [Streptomyces nigrescens]|uniref:DUF6082 family protein n=1 Tax=Streptomyces nigrescens TaxID=1920 RepID=UPI003700D2AD
MATNVEKVHGEAEALALVETALSWDVHGADLPAVETALSMAEELTSYGRILVDDLRKQCLDILADSDVVARAQATLGEASRRLYLWPLAGSASPQSATQRAQNLARSRTGPRGTGAHHAPTVGAHHNERHRPMKASHAAILGLAAVGAVQIAQKERHQRQRNEIAVARIHQDWLTHLTTHPDLAKLWAPEDIAPEQYVELLNANQQINGLGLRHRLGIVRDQQLPFLATYLMGREHCRRYWQRFGAFRGEEALGDQPEEHFNEVMNDAYVSHQEPKPADA